MQYAQINNNFVQVLNNRMFSPRDRTVEQIRAEPNGNGNHVDENGKKISPPPLTTYIQDRKELINSKLAIL